ncbi:MAG TPA: enolase C-terminal domain-like protein [Acidimicrobiia bacterium]
MSDLRIVRLRIPLTTPVRGVTARDVTLVHGPHGWGESSPFPGIGVSRASCDRAARQAGERAMPPARRVAVEVNALIVDTSPVAAAAAAEAAVAAGHRVLKLKVGDDQDVARVAAVRRAVGDAPALRIDANGAWTVPEAIERIGRLAEVGIELCEEPVGGLERMARLRAGVEVPIAADESVRSLGDARRLAELGAADVLVLKVQACGGVWPALEWAGAAGVPVVVTSMIETSVGLAMGLALAAALPDLPYASGLGTARLLERDVVAEPLVPVAGMLDVRRPEPDEALLLTHSVPE